MRAGVIGLGMIGGGVSECLARTGQLAAVYDVRKEAADGLAGVPALAASPAAVAEAADVVIIAVVSAQQTVDVLTGPEGVLAHARPGLSVVLVATVSMTELDKIRALTDAAGVVLVDCGVTGGGKVRENGLTCLVGGTDGQLAAVRPVLDGFARAVFHMGGPGAGMAAKIARNVIVYGCMRAGYEAATLCRQSGVDVAALNEVLEASADAVGGPLIVMARPEMNPAAREHLRGLLRKDLGAARDLAASAGIRLPMVDLTIATDEQVVGLADQMGEKV